MTSMITRVENHRTFYLFPLSESGGKFDNKPAYLDASAALKEANSRDKGLGYPREGGPNFAQEQVRAAEYAVYVSQYCNSDNLHKFNVPKRNYLFFVNTQDEKRTNKKR